MPSRAIDHHDPSRSSELGAHNTAEPPPPLPPLEPCHGLPHGPRQYRAGPAVVEGRGRRAPRPAQTRAWEQRLLPAPGSDRNLPSPTASPATAAEAKNAHLPEPPPGGSRGRGRGRGRGSAVRGIIRRQKGGHGEATSGRRCHCQPGTTRNPARPRCGSACLAARSGLAYRLRET
jgi:hypothetical protein